MEISLDIDINGYMSQEEIDMRLKILGELIVQEVKKLIREMKLIDTTLYLQGWITSVKNGVLVIENRTEYSIYLEYGTYDYWQKHGLTSYTDPTHPKKKDMSYKERQNYPKGMQAFAPVRKVVYNPIIMQELVTEAFS